MNIYAGRDIQSVELHTMRKLELSSFELMELAVDGLYKEIKKYVVPKDWNWIILAGKGNNGGDGLGLARRLKKDGCSVRVIHVAGTKKLSENHQIQYNLAEMENLQMSSDVDMGMIESNVIIVDALLGIGLRGKAEGEIKAAIDAVNHSQARAVLSIDVPSGISCDEYSGGAAPHIVHADKTMMIGSPKMSFFYREYSDYFGDVSLVDIGLHSDEQIAPIAYQITQADCVVMFKQRDKYEHKHSIGHSLLLGGSEGMLGGLILAAKASLNAGTGLLSVCSNSNYISEIHSVVPEAISLELDQGLAKIESGRIHAVGMGMGFGLGDVQKESLIALLTTKVPMVIDADALTILSENDTIKDLLHERCILSPHMGEWERIAGAMDSTADAIEKLTSFSKKYQCCVLLKGPNTFIADGHGDLHIVSCGNPGMAVGGSGDALTGLLTALLARRYTPLEAASMAAYIHGTTADILAEDIGKESITPSKWIDNYWRVIKEIENQADTRVFK